MQCHHIIQEADGGPDSLDNCLPLCPDCHAEVQAYNPRHPSGGTPYHSIELTRRRDDWYMIVKRKSQELATNLHHCSASYPHCKLMRGTVQFNYSHYNGFYRLGEGSYEFLTHWTKSSDTNIQCYRDGTNISIALPAKDIRLQEIRDASLLHYSSRVQRPQLGQFVVFENHNSRYAAAKILKIHDVTRGHSEDLLSFEYWILDDDTDDFSNIA